MSRLLALVIVVVLVACGGLFYAAPLISFYDVRSACKSQDVESLAKLINFDAVRTSLRTQIEAGDAGIAAPAPSPLNDPAGAAGNAVKNIGDAIGKTFNDIVHPKSTPAAPPKPVVDPNTYLTPKAILALTYGEGKDANIFDPATFQGKPPGPKMAFFSLEHARLTVTDQAHGTTTFTFERQGLTHWEMVHIGLPTPESSAAAPSASSSSEF